MILMSAERLEIFGLTKLQTSMLLAVNIPEKIIAARWELIDAYHLDYVDAAAEQEAKNRAEFLRCRLYMEGSVLRVELYDWETQKLESPSFADSEIVLEYIREFNLAMPAELRSENLQDRFDLIGSMI